jgi:predicted transcriptional regulator
MQRFVLSLFVLSLLVLPAGAIEPMRPGNLTGADNGDAPSAKSTGIGLDVPPLDMPTASRQTDPDQARAEARQIEEKQDKLLLLFKQQNYAQAKQYASDIVDLNPADGISWYNLACAHCRLGEHDEALSALKTAIDRGYAGIRYMQHDPDLRGLHLFPGFQALLRKRDEIQRARAERIVAELKDRYGRDCLIEVDHKTRIIYASNTDRRTLEEVQQELSLRAEVLWRDLFDHRFEEYITVLIPKPGTVNMGIAAGVYRHADSTLVVKRIGMTLRHEFTHALHFSDLEARGQMHPIWLLEGLATLYETAKLTGGTLQPMPNERLNALQYYLKKGKSISLEDFLDCTQTEFMEQAGLSYGMARYLMMYLHHTGKLRAFYDRYTEDFNVDRTGRRALTKVFGKQLDEIERDWLAWVDALPTPAQYVKTNHAYMGVRSHAVLEGLEVLQVVPGSGADDAGLQTGDLIVQIDSHRIADGGDLIRLVSERQIGDSLRVRFRRGREYQNVDVLLGPKPAIIPLEKVITEP